MVKKLNFDNKVLDKTKSSHSLYHMQQSILVNNLKQNYLCHLATIWFITLLKVFDIKLRGPWVYVERSEDGTRESVLKIWVIIFKKTLGVFLQNSRFKVQITSISPSFVMIWTQVSHYEFQGEFYITQYILTLILIPCHATPCGTCE